MRPEFRVTAVAFCALLLIPSLGSSDWDPGFAPPARLEGRVTDMELFGGRLIVAGWKLGVWNLDPTHLMAFDGENWESLLPAEPNDNLRLHALLAWDDLLVIAGCLREVHGVPARNIAVYDGEGWSALGEGIPIGVRCLAVHGGELYAGTMGAYADGDPSCLWRWDGASWHAVPLPEGEMWGYPVALLSQPDGLWVGGTFLAEGDLSHLGRGAYRWDGSAWSLIGEGLRGDAMPEDPLLPLGLVGVHALTNFQGQVYAAGSFHDQVKKIRGLARWTGSEWEALPSNGTGLDLVEFRGRLVPAGTYSHRLPDGSWRAEHAGWDGEQWHLLADANTGRSYQVAQAAAAVVFQDELFLGWDHQETQPFTELPAERMLVAYDGERWRDLASPRGVLGQVRAVIDHGGELVLGGRFDWAGGRVQTNVARWDGVEFRALGGGLHSDLDCHLPTGLVRSFLHFDGELVAGGRFALEPGGLREDVALWDGASWRPAGLGVRGPEEWSSRGVEALIRYDDRMVAAGEFDTAGGLSVRGLALWDGDRWYDDIPGPDPLPADEPTWISSAVVHQGRLVICGDFLSVDGVATGGLARWDGERWEAVAGTTVRWPQGKLASFAGDLYVAGRTTPVGAPLYRVLDGELVSVYLGLVGEWLCLLSTEAWLYLGSGERLVRWDGSQYQDLAEGIFYDLAPHDQALAFAGSMWAEGELVSQNAGILWMPQPVAGIVLSLEAWREGEDVRLRWPAAVLPGSGTLRLERGDATSPWATRISWPAGQAPEEWVDPDAPTDCALRYRLAAEVDGVLSWGESVELAAVGPETPPSRSILRRPFPNPFNPRTTLRFEIAEPGPTRLRIVTLSGRLLCTMDLGPLGVGPHETPWDGRDDRGRPVASGAYLAVLEAPDATDTVKLVLLR